MEENKQKHIHHEGGHCQDLLDRLSEFVDGTLERKLCDEIEEHLKDCRNCTIVVDTLRKTIRLYRVEAHSTVMPEDVRRRLYKNLDLEEYMHAPEAGENRANHEPPETVGDE